MAVNLSRDGVSIGQPRVGRRGLLAGAGALTATAATAAVAPAALSAGVEPTRFGVAWRAAPTLSVGVDGGVLKPIPLAQTARLIVHPLAGGPRLRLRFSNLRGLGPLRLGPVHVGLRGEGARVRPGTHRQVRFGGRAVVVIPPGAEVVSDVVARPIRAFEDLAVSVFVPLGLPNPTGHQAAFQTSYLSLPGDHAADESGDPFVLETTSWPFLCGVDVATSRPTIVTLGDSITDCSRTTVDANHRWPDFLARRFAASARVGPVGIANAGISANQILRDELLVPGGGDSAIRRFARDVAAVPGATDVIIHEGTNDIGLSLASGEEVIAGLLQLAALARAAGLRVHATTILPAGTAQLPGHRSPRGIAARATVNDWLRRHWRRSFDSLTDLAVVLADPRRPTALAPRFDSGDGLHPNDRGTRAMAAAFDLSVIAPLSARR